MMWRSMLEGCIRAAFGPGAWMIQAMPDRLVSTAADVLGSTHGALHLPLLRPRIEQNMRFAIGPEFRSEWVRRNLQVLYRSAAHLIRLPQYTDDGFLQHLGTLENGGELRRWRASGVGCVLVGLHFGNHRFLAPGLAAMGFPVSNLVARFPQPKVGFRASTRKRVSTFRADYIDKSRVDYVGTTCEKSSHAVNVLVERVRNGSFLLLLADGCIGHAREPVNFLGQQFAMPVGAAVIAARAGAPLVPILSTPNPRRVLVADAIAVDCASVANAMGRVMATFEPMVRAEPWQWWTWFHLGLEGVQSDMNCWRLLSGAEAFAPSFRTRQEAISG